LVITDASFNVLDSTGVAITVTPCVPPIAGFTFSPAGPFCADSCITFTSTSTYTPTATFSWDFGNGQGNSSENPGAPICFNTAGSYSVTLTVTDANGSDSETQVIVIEDCTPPTAGFTMSDTEICEGQCIFFNNASTNGSFYQWTFEGGNPPASYLPFPGDVCFEDEGTFTITLVAGNNYGSDTITSQVLVNPSPSVETSNDQTIFSSHETQIEAVSSDPNVTYVWTPTDWLDCPDCPVTTVAPEDTIIYVVTVTNEFGCSDSSNVLIEVEYIEEIGVPSAFSPQGDEHNDILYVQGAGIKKMEFKIYNRYGQLVFESTDQEFGWDGTFQGKDENAGVFVYYVIYDNSTSEDNILQGNVTLRR
jgi:gliding motility-associated-like protein